MIRLNRKMVEIVNVVLCLFGCRIGVIVVIVELL